MTGRKEGFPNTFILGYIRIDKKRIPFNQHCEIMCILSQIGYNIQRNHSLTQYTPIQFTKETFTPPGTDNMHAPGKSCGQKPHQVAVSVLFSICICPLYARRVVKVPFQCVCFGRNRIGDKCSM